MGTNNDDSKVISTAYFIKRGLSRSELRKLIILLIGFYFDTDKERKEG